MNSPYIYHSNVDQQKSVTITHNLSANTSVIASWNSVLNIGFQPDEVIVDVLSYISTVNEQTGLILYADFCNSLRQTYSNGAQTDLSITNSLGIVSESCNYSPNIRLPITSVLGMSSKFYIESLDQTSAPVGTIGITLRFIKFLPKK